MIKIKSCCILTVKEMETAVSAGVDAIGLVSEMPSGPGVISEAEIKAILADVPSNIDTFLLTRLTDKEKILKQHGKCRSTTIQFVDEVPVDDLVFVKQRLPGVKLVQVIHVLSEKDIEQALKIQKYVDAILLDSGNPCLKVKELGGTGRVHDWKLSAEIRAKTDVPVYLAGGLNPENVGSAIQAVRPYGVDVCSGIRTKGRLDEDKLKRFIAETKSQSFPDY